MCLLPTILLSPPPPPPLQGSSATPQPYHEGQPGGHVPLQLLALHPALAARLAATNTWTEYSALLGGLMTVGVGFRGEGWLVYGGLSIPAQTKREPTKTERSAGRGFD